MIPQRDTPGILQEFAEVRSWGRRGILMRTAFLSWIVVILALGMFLAFIIPNQRDLLTQRLESTAEVLATSIAQITVTSIIIEDYSPVIEHCLKLVRERPTVLYLVITRRDGFSLVHQAERWSTQQLGAQWRPQHAPQGTIETSELAGSEVFHYAYPLTYSGIDWGWIHIGLSLAQFRADLHALYLRTILLAMLCMLAASIFSLFFARRVIRPIQQLDRIASRIASGELDVRAHISTGDEVESLARSFNHMTESLQKAHEDLERRVEVRTDELQVANKRLQQEMAERKEIEQDLVRLERLRAVGELSGGFCHNLNNILTSILGPAEMLRASMQDPQHLWGIEMISKGAQRAADLVQRLHQAVRYHPEMPLQPVFFNREVREALQATRTRWKDDAEARGLVIHIQSDLAEETCIQGSSSELHDLLINVLFNSLDAMPAGGSICLRTEIQGNDLLFTMSDTGTGMDEETRRRVFEPFFTTKRDVGSGLGLSTVYGTVQRWGGDVAVESSPGNGTCFRFRFPIWTAAAAESADAPPGDEAVRRSRILIIEDDPAVEELLHQLLASSHDVASFTNGGDAVAGFVAGRFDVALIDLGLPGLPGDRVAQQLRQDDPWISTVLMTGWILSAADPRAAAFDFQLRKPFTNLTQVNTIVARAVRLHDTRRDVAPGSSPHE